MCYYIISCTIAACPHSIFDLSRLRNHLSFHGLSSLLQSIENIHNVVSASEHAVLYTNESKSEDEHEDFYFCYRLLLFSHTSLCREAISMLELNWKPPKFSPMHPCIYT